MRRIRPHLAIGTVVFLAGGAVLAFGPGTQSTVVGTMMGITGAGLLIWGWLGRE